MLLLAQRLGNGLQGLARRIEANGYQVAGNYRELFLVHPEPGRDPSTYVTEIQVPVRKG